jgi:hypothetical protein
MQFPEMADVNLTYWMAGIWLILSALVLIWLGTKKSSSKMQPSALMSSRLDWWWLHSVRWFVADPAAGRDSTGG